ncbi:MAG: tetratricopeptide repeat protein [Candidatus Methylumidiphilus sp.]
MQAVTPWIQHLQQPLVLAGIALLALAGLGKWSSLGKHGGGWLDGVFVLALLAVALGLGQSLLNPPPPARHAVAAHTSPAVPAPPRQAEAVTAAADTTACNPQFGDPAKAPPRIHCAADIPPAALAALESHLAQQLRGSRSPGALLYSQRLDIADWERQYRRQSQNLAADLRHTPHDPMLQAARQAWAAGELEQAAQLLEQRLLDAPPPAGTLLGAGAYAVGVAYQLALKPLSALPYLLKARDQQTDSFAYGFAYAWALHKQNRRPDAEAAYREALRLARAEPARPDHVAQVLVPLANLLGEDSRRRAEAESLLREAVQRLRPLALEQPDALPDLAVALDTLAAWLRDSRQPTAAEGFFQDALKAYRRLAQDDPERYLPDVAAALNSLGFLLAEDSRRHGEAQAAYQEALQIRRELAKNSPALYLPDVAATLNNLGLLAADDSRRRAEAEAHCQEALKIYRQMARDNPAAHLGHVAATLDNLASLVGDDGGRRAEAEGLHQQALKIRRQLAYDNPAAHLPQVAATLNNLANLIGGDSRRRAEAEGYLREALKIRRELAQDKPAALAMALNNLGLLLAQDSQRRGEAEALYQEALQAYRQLAQDSPAPNLPQVAATLNNLANLAGGDARRRGEAENLYREALAIRRQLAQDNPAVHVADVAATLDNLAGLVGGDGRRQAEAEALYREALALRRPLAADDPAAHLADVAATLNNLAALLSGDGRRRADAEALYREALAIRRRLAQDNPAPQQPQLAAGLHNLALLAAEDPRRRAEAEGHYREALAIRRQLAQDHPSTYQPELAYTLAALGRAQLRWQAAQARATLQEAAELLRPYAGQDPGVFGDRQAATLHWLALAEDDAERACQRIGEALALAQTEGVKAALSKAQAGCPHGAAGRPR